MDVDHWTELNSDLLDEILTRMNYSDHIKLRAVCKRWSLKIPKNPKHAKNPWLVLPSKDEIEINHPLLNFGENAVYHLNLSETQKIVFCGSYYEWLVTLAIEGALRILNPFTRAQFELPPLTTFPDVKAYQPDRLGAEYTLVDFLDHSEYNIEKNLMHAYHVSKIIISAPPDHDDQDFVAMAIYGEYRTLAWCRIGDSRWIDVPCLKIHCHYEDAIFHEGKMYVVDCEAQIYEFDMKTGLGGISAMATPPNLCLDNSDHHRRYLVGTPDGLLMVVRCIKSYPRYITCNGEELDYCYRTFEFKVYKFNRGKWLKMNNLKNLVILLGQNCSQCLSFESFPDSKGNQIYFTDDLKDFHNGVTGGHDIGVFNLEDESINHLFRDEYCSWPPPVWLAHKVH